MADEYGADDWAVGVVDTKTAKGAPKKTRRKARDYLPMSVDELDDPIRYADPERSFFKLLKSMFWPR